VSRGYSGGLVVNLIRSARTWAVVAFSLLAGACSQQPDAVKQKEARDAYAQLARGDYAGFEARLSPEALAVSTPADRQKLYAFAKSNVPTEAPKSVATVSWQVTSGSAGSSYALLDDYEYQSKYIEVTTVLKRDSGSNKDAVAGFHFNVINKNQVADRSLIPKTLPQFALSAAAAAALLVTLVAMVQVFTRKGVKRRWLWFVFVIFGVGMVKFNWDTGQVVLFMPLAFQLFSVGVFRGVSVVSLWLIQLSIPLGAIVFLACAKHHAKEARFEAQRQARLAVKDGEGSA
jgi:hypothetical protein